MTHANEMKSGIFIRCVTATVEGLILMLLYFLVLTDHKIFTESLTVCAYDPQIEMRNKLIKKKKSSQGWTLGK